ncbi:hypothetical protein M2475_000561 [Breznakia sp. PF5-3]|uniref:phage head-tail adapter protein n=1 Tax=unclassified Breznakia TaxID=2623764 RepID=UPI0024049157|nr:MULTISPECIES: phage head-tail adapter protein [unclassified Breznakia]MDF9824203.1 hypothetical protein [Breznakia sp. PM6-1]MDF9835001.1 hypothetical protein [Breznakia sp. PF5-3]MDF9837246.1 hypothetical protein [Breznakia sp. PFB2-8]MDF9859236.1 hypothetical protein [Breznakia sp. PH5-24]
MSSEWSDLNKTMQNQIKKKDSFNDGINTLLELRKGLLKEIFKFKDTIKRNDFDKIPFINAKGYHNKTIVYSLWHIFRIEDIVTHTLIQKDKQIFFDKDYQKRINSPIITTGNELVKEEISDFSKDLNLDELYQYIVDVNESTIELLRNLSYSDLKIQMSNMDKEQIKELKVVSDDENAAWLIDYWCKKNIKGLITMPLSRHWIMHVDACSRILKKVL